MLPDSLIELFDITGSDDFPSPGTQDTELAELVQAAVTHTSLLNTMTVKFARSHDLNHIDFQVLTAIITSANSDITVTPGYISDSLALSASTLTSILERLAKRELIVRDRDSADKRRIALYYTEDAARLMVEYYRALGAGLQGYFDAHRPELQTTTRSLKAVNAALAPLTEEG